jgi:methylenetetrahydrofolate reductase (NADPH)
MVLTQNVEFDADLKSAIIDLLGDFTTETTPPGAAKIADFREYLPIGSTVFITFLPGSDFDDTITTARRLRREGFIPVPHIAARSIPSAGFLDDRLRRLSEEAGIKEALVVAGALAQPIGEFTSSMDVLGTGLLDKYGVSRIGIAGHPEGSPDIKDEDIASALAWKNAFAERTAAELYIVTQFCFEAGPVITWDKRIQAAGNRLPIRVGVPGLASIKSLLNYARLCGIGPSMNFIAKQARNVTKLVTLSAPDRLLAELASYRARDPSCGITGCHIYPLGGLQKTTRWAQAVLEGRFRLERRSAGFRVDVPFD